MTSWDRWIEQKIQKAMEDGAFENLPGQGKPLDLEDDALTDPDWRVAYRMLRSSGFSLPWIENRRDIEQQIKAAREGLARSLDWLTEQGAGGAVPAAVQQEWDRAVSGFRRQFEMLNLRIADYNLEAPVLSLQMVPLDPERELAAVLHDRQDPGPV